MKVFWFRDTEGFEFPYSYGKCQNPECRVCYPDQKVLTKPAAPETKDLAEE